jgi:hypothetical protein
VKSTIGWILAITFGVLLLLLLPGLWMMGRFWMGGYGSMMGGSGMMGGYNTMNPFGSGGILLGWLVPVGVIVLLIVGVAVIVNTLNKSGRQIVPTAASGRTCSNCGKPAQFDWNTCPYCGQKLS